MSNFIRLSFANEEPPRSSLDITIPTPPKILHRHGFDLVFLGPILYLVKITTLVQGAHVEMDALAGFGWIMPYYGTSITPALQPQPKTFISKGLSGKKTAYSRTIKDCLILSKH